MQLPLLLHCLYDTTPKSCSLSKPSSDATCTMNFPLINKFKKESYLPLNSQHTLSLCFFRQILFYLTEKLFVFVLFPHRRKAPWGQDPCIIHFVTLRTWQRIYFVNFCWMHGYRGDWYSAEDNTWYLGKQICISFWISQFNFSYIF